ncbi:gliding motility-associated C-terminal domain-containing protein [Arenibacter aquaticus]|uniref:Gliding motility-associated C-terminal domain-containing protein n=1 Tax=Arenibacter aquaticus TaxID=2489054 RepID=A0A3S0D479_9FLAO|nr:gliding motility-associated C-terminal domain-containing protein [Arenibacter aquaticus]RTE52675.1 gliding motility-associated C-terminal domain-containing protein [Arenibacter aquaticus]
MNTIKYITTIFILAVTLLGHSQDAVHNYGNMQVHESAMVGFHMDVINDGTFDENLGLVGFYNEEKTLSISGAFSPVFYDTEVSIEDGLYLDIPVEIKNNFNFINGNLYTPKDRSSAYLKFSENSFFVGEGNRTKVDGYVSAENKENFTFPVGDEDRIRSLSISTTESQNTFKCAYFFENPNSPLSMDNNFNTSTLDLNVSGVSDKEFWRLEGYAPVNATLSWDDYSNIGGLGEYISDLTVVGWSKKQLKWMNLGNTALEGSFSSGSITSATFIPNEYEIITIGGAIDMNETLTTIELGNYFLTPNGDGKNDFLVIDGIAESPNNLLQIFNRYGVLVYYKENYNDEFEGLSNRDMVVKGNIGLPSGVYFYIIVLKDLKIRHQGYLYLSQTVKN